MPVATLPARPDPADTRHLTAPASGDVPLPTGGPVVNLGTLADVTAAARVLCPNELTPDHRQPDRNSLRAGRRAASAIWTPDVRRRLHATAEALAATHAGDLLATGDSSLAARHRFAAEVAGGVVAHLCSLSTSQGGQRLRQWAATLSAAEQGEPGEQWVRIEASNGLDDLISELVTSRRSRMSDDAVSGLLIAVESGLLHSQDALAALRTMLVYGPPSIEHAVTHSLDRCTRTGGQVTPDPGSEDLRFLVRDALQEHLLITDGEGVAVEAVELPSGRALAVGDVARFNLRHLLTPYGHTVPNPPPGALALTFGSGPIAAVLAEITVETSAAALATVRFLRGSAPS